MKAEEAFVDYVKKRLAEAEESHRLSGLAEKDLIGYEQAMATAKRIFFFGRKCAFEEVLEIIDGN